MRDFIHPLGGFESVVFTWLDRTDAQQQLITMEGWEWFYVATVDLVLVNTGGALAANLAFAVQYQGVNVIRATSTVQAGAGATSVYFLGVGTTQATISGTSALVSLPLVICPNGSNISIAFTNGDAGTRIGKGSLTVHGVRRLNKARS